MTKLDKLLTIKNSQCYYDDYSVDREEFEKLKKQIETALRLERIAKRWSKDEGYSHAELCKELLEESRNTVSRQGFGGKK